MSDAWDGVPENPERSGPHWLRDRQKPDVVLLVGWRPDIQQWMCGEPVSPAEASSWWSYEGPCLTPEEVAAREAASAEAALSDAAELATALGEPAIALEIHALPVPGVVALARALAAAEKRGMEKAAEIAKKAWPRAHTYASENADLYRAQDHAVSRVVAAIRNAAAQESEG